MSDLEDKQPRKTGPPAASPLQMRSPEAIDEAAEPSVTSNGLAGHTQATSSPTVPDLSAPHDLYSPISIDEVAIEALTAWLEMVKQAQGGEKLHLTPEVRAALTRLEGVALIGRRVDQALNRPNLSDQPAGLARALVDALRPLDAGLLTRIETLVKQTIAASRPDNSALAKLKRFLEKLGNLRPPPPSDTVERLRENMSPLPPGGLTDKDKFLLHQLGRQVPGGIEPVSLPLNLARTGELFPKRTPSLPPVDAEAIAFGLPPEYFESEIPTKGPRSGLTLKKLKKLITHIATELRAYAEHGGPVPLVVDLGSNFPPTPPTFERGLQLILEALKRAWQLPYLPPVSFRYKFGPEPLGPRPRQRR